MNKFFPLLILFSLLLGACSQSDIIELHHERKAVAQVYKPIPADFQPRKLTVVSAGDSLTKGVGDSKDQGGYLPYLKAMLEKEKSSSDKH